MVDKSSCTGVIPPVCSPVVEKPETVLAKNSIRMAHSFYFTMRSRTNAGPTPRPEDEWPENAEPKTTRLISLRLKSRRAPIVRG